MFGREVNEQVAVCGGDFQTPGKDKHLAGILAAYSMLGATLRAVLWSVIESTPMLCLKALSTIELDCKSFVSDILRRAIRVDMEVGGIE